MKVYEVVDHYDPSEYCYISKERAEAKAKDMLDTCSYCEENQGRTDCSRYHYTCEIEVIE